MVKEWEWLPPEVAKLRKMRINLIEILTNEYILPLSFYYEYKAMTTFNSCVAEEF